MSFTTEKVMKKMNEYLAQHATDEMSEAEMQELLERFMEEHNRSLPGNRLTEKTAKTAADFLQLAEEATSEKTAFRFVKKALALEPDNLDAKRMWLNDAPLDPFERFELLEKAVQEGREQMEKLGFNDAESIGHYWGILETRPYMRLLDDYVFDMLQSGMYGKAMAVCEEMLRLCKNDNLGKRFTLMHLYAFFENEVAALGLLKKYSDHDETQMLVALSVLYYKLGQWNKADEYLQRAQKINKDVKKFFRSVFEQSYEKFSDFMEQGCYQPYTVEELIVEMMENEFLFHSTPGFMLWADRQLQRKRTRK